MNSRSANDIGGRNRYWHLLIGKPNAYHPSFVGTLREAVTAAMKRADEERCSVRVAYNPGARVSNQTRVVAVVAWTKDGSVVQVAAHDVEKKLRRARRVKRRAR